MQESFKTNMQHCRDPNIKLIIVFEVFGLLLRKKKVEGFPSQVHFCLSIQLLMWDNSLLLSNLWACRNSEILRISPQPLHSQQPGIYKRGCFPWSSSCGISVSIDDTTSSWRLFLKDEIVAFLMHLFNTFFRFIENNQINSISPNAFRGLKTLVHL